MISVLMCAANQGHFLRKTIESAIGALKGAKEWEIVIVDDHSTDGSIDQIQYANRVRVVSAPGDVQYGISACRRFAAQQAKGDVLIYTDTHCYFPRRAFHRLASWARRLRAIVVPPIRLEGAQVRSAEGGRLSISRRGLHLDRPPHRAEWPALFGSIYCMSRWVYDSLGGWPGLPGVWGWDEQIVTVMAYRLGIPIYVLTKEQFLTHHRELCLHRKYREHGLRSFPFVVSPESVARIGHYFHAACFPETYPTVWQPLLTKYYGMACTEVLDDAAKLREYIDRRCVWSEQRFLSTVLKCDDLPAHPVIQEALKGAA